MYVQYFGLEQPPFRVTPDCRLFYGGGNRGAILDALAYAVNNGEAIIKVVGEVGSGKTMLCRMLESRLGANVDIIYLANPSLSPDNILHAIALELGLPLQDRSERLRVMHALQQCLLRKHSQARRVVMFIEEAQSMPKSTLEEIRLLSNLETQRDKLLQMVLFGQPELDVLLASKDIRQLRERIAFSFTLMPLSEGEVREYICARLQACGCPARDLFTPEAIRLIHRHSKGLLRRINILADKSMLAAYAAGLGSIVDGKAVRRAVRDSNFGLLWKDYRPGIGTLTACASGFALTLLVATAQHALMRVHKHRQLDRGQVSVPLSGKVDMSRRAAVAGVSSVLPAHGVDVTEAKGPPAAMQQTDAGGVTR